MAPHLVDIGANLTHSDFSEDLHQVLERALDQQVLQMVVTGASREGSQDAVQLAERFPDMLVSTVGVHPHHAVETNQESLKELEDLARSEAVKAIGETGLDFFRDFSPRDMQQKSFENHIELAIKLGLPLFLHERDSSARFYEMIRKYRDEIEKLVVHCFTADKKTLHAYLDLDCHIGITGWICDERRGEHLIPLVKDVPSDRLMIETDAPYLLPRNIRPKPTTRRNEPQFLTYVCQAIADATGKHYDLIAEETSATARHFFNLAHPDDIKARDTKACHDKSTLPISFYTTLGCHLCEEALQMLRQVTQNRADLSVQEVEISHVDELVQRYGVRIPVIRFKNRELGWPFSLEQLLTFIETHHR